MVNLSERWSPGRVSRGGQRASEVGDAGVEEAPIDRKTTEVSRSLDVASSTENPQFEKVLAELRASHDVQEKPAPADGSPYSPLQLTRRGRTKVEGLGIRIDVLQDYVLQQREGKTKGEMRSDRARQQEQAVAAQAAQERSRQAQILAERARNLMG